MTLVAIRKILMSFLTMIMLIFIMEKIILLNEPSWSDKRKDIEGHKGALVSESFKAKAKEMIYKKCP